VVLCNDPVVLGFVKEIVWTDDDHEHVIRWPNKTSYRSSNKAAVLVCNKHRNALYVLPWERSKRRNLSSTKRKQKAVYSLWSGLQPDCEYQLWYPPRQETLFLVGRIQKIDYTSDKLTEPGDRPGDWHLYTHDFERPPKFYAARAKTPRVFGVLDEKGRKLVSSRGIIS